MIRVKVSKIESVGDFIPIDAIVGDEILKQLDSYTIEQIEQNGVKCILVKFYDKDGKEVNLEN
jgi:hypothetical protein